MGEPVALREAYCQQALLPEITAETRVVSGYRKQHGKEHVMTAIHGGAMLGMALCCAVTTHATPRNLARNQPYTFSDPPNYRLCTDEGDAIQLTDGKRVHGKLWTQKGTVGWGDGGLKGITIDLGRVYPIRGAMVSTGGGVAGVHWPASIHLFVSDDGRAWYPVGDLIVLSARTTPAPPYGKYAKHEFRTNALRTSGRYVCFAVEANGLYVFSDEIEVYEGDPAFLANPRGGAPWTDVIASLRNSASMRPVKEQFLRDLVAATDDLAAARLSSRVRTNLAAKADSLKHRIKTMPKMPFESFRAVLPMNELERDIFRFQAAVWRAQGKAALRLWKTHRWDPLAPSQEPNRPGMRPEVNVVMMQNEVRADVLNITNAAARDLVARVRIEGLPGGTNPDWLTIHAVTAVGTRRFVAVSAALPIAQRIGQDWVITVPSGMTRQLWFSFHSTRVPPGDYAGNVRLCDDEQALAEAPVRVRIAPVRFPDQTTLNLGGWSYTDAVGSYGITSKNRDALIKTLREHNVNAPWATGAVMPTGIFDAAGKLAEPPDTNPFDAFVALWPGARHYMVFLGRGGSGGTVPEFAGSNVGTPLFQTKVANWIRFWGDHFRAIGLKPEQVGLLIVDEPDSEASYNTLAAYAQVINRVEPRITLWLDPRVHDNEPCLNALKTMDVLVAHRPEWMPSKPWTKNLFTKFGNEGKQLGLYSAAGPARTFDPYSYYLLQQWQCRQIGATWSGFWSFGGDNGFSVWNEYATQGYGSYCPLYLDNESVTTAKYMEAIREGVQDYEYLVLLRRRVEQAEAAGKRDPVVRKARHLLENACSRVLHAKDAEEVRWDKNKDRSVADNVRREIIHALIALAPEKVNR